MREERQTLYYMGMIAEDDMLIKDITDDEYTENKLFLVLPKQNGTEYNPRFVVVGKSPNVHNLLQGGILKLRMQARGRGGLAKCLCYYISLCSKLAYGGGREG